MMKADFPVLRGAFRFHNYHPIQDFTRRSQRLDGTTEIAQKVFENQRSACQGLQDEVGS
jgi:hypothetical protein